VVAHFWHQSSWVYSVDCHVSILLQSFLPGLVCSSLGLSSACLIHSQSHFPINTFLLPSCHVPSSTSPNCFVGYEWYQYDIKCNASYSLRMSVYVNVSYMCYIASTKFAVADFCMSCIRLMVWSH